jgi:hypothetical protein
VVLEVRTERPVTSQEKLQALSLVLHSETLARSDQLRKFLRYVAEMEDAGRGNEITEYSIATEALGRPASYSPADDSSVRGRAHDLRQKIEQFYKHEHPDARIRVALHKGSYVPYFYEVATPPEENRAAPLVPAAPTATPPVLKRKRSFWGLAAILLTFLTGSVTGAFWMKQHSRPPDAAVFEQFWGPMLHAGSDVLICLATPPSLRIKPFPAAPRHPGFQTASKDTARWYASLGLPGLGEPYVYRSATSPLFGDAAAAIQAAQTIAAYGGSCQFLPENIIVGEVALAKRNILVIGAPNYSPYAARVLKNTPFTIEESSEVGEEIIRERSPKSGAPLVLVPSRGQSGRISVAFGLITVFPNRTGSDDGPRAIVVSGITGAGAPAAMEFFTSAAGLMALRDRFRKDGLSRAPASYQVVVKGSRDEAMPLNWQMVTYRVMEHPPSLE